MQKVFALAFLWVGVANAQFGREAVWMTGGSNAQRSSWVRADAKISKASILSGFQFLWKVKPDAEQSKSLSEPILMDRYIGYQGFRSFAFMGGAADSVYAVDTDLNRIEWRKRISSESSNCSAATGASVTLPTAAEFPSALGNFGFFGRGGPAKSGVGGPYQGAVTLAATAAPMAVPTPPRRPAGPPRVRTPIVLYALTSDGMLHAMYVSNGTEPEPPVKFVPPNAAARGLIVVNNMAYAVSGQECGAAAGVWALDLATKEVTTWTGEGARLAGLEGAAIGPDGTLYVATAAGDSTYSSSVVALEAKTLKPKDWYTAPQQEFASSPVIFQYKNKVFVAAVTKDGQVHILETTSLGGADHRTPLCKTPASSDGGNFVSGTLASWQDSEFTRWLLASASGGVVAWKIVDRDGAPAVEPGWVSRNMKSPAPPMIVNGVAFAVSRAVLYALDAETGKELWNSGKTISSSVEAAGLSAGGGQVYVTARNGTLYAFGFPMEH